MTENTEQPEQSILQPLIPVMSKERFAELSGVTYGVVDGWCNRGYVPTLRIGKRTMVNMVQLQQDCLEQLSR